MMIDFGVDAYEPQPGATSQVVTRHESPKGTLFRLNFTLNKYDAESEQVLFWRNSDSGSGEGIAGVGFGCARQATLDGKRRVNFRGTPNWGYFADGFFRFCSWGGAT